MRMMLLAVEQMLQEADESGHPQIIGIAFGGPAPYELARAL